MNPNALHLVNAFPEATFLLDSTGRVLAANRAARASVQMPRGPGTGDLTLEKVVQNDRPTVARAFALWSGASMPSRAQLKFLSPDGDVIERRCDGWRWMGPNGDFVVVRLVKEPMTSRLGELTRTIDRFNVESAAHARAERDLRQLIRDMNNQNSIRDLVISHVSHDLRTPLNAILGMSEFMMQQPFGELQPRYVEYLQDIRTSGEALLELVDRVLTLSADAGVSDEADSRRCDLALCINNCRRLIEPIAERRDIVLRLPEGKHLPTLLADRVLIKQVLTNLLGNAVKYLRPGDEVALDVLDPPEGGLCLQVSDNGPGIPKDKLARLLDTGERDPFVSEHGSGGIGLYLSGRAMESLGGSLQIESEEGAGTRVRLLLPPEIVDRSPPQSRPQAAAFD